MTRTPGGGALRAQRLDKAGQILLERWMTPRTLPLSAFRPSDGDIRISVASLLALVAGLGAAALGVAPGSAAAVP